MSGTASAGYGLATAVIWGAADFAGGLAAKKANVFKVVLVAHGSSLIFMLVLALFSREPLPASATGMWGGLAGFAGGFGVLCLYRALAIGKMGTVAPIAAVLTAILPVFAAAFTQGRPKMLHVAGFCIAAIAIVLMSKPEKLGDHPRGLGLAVLAGLGFGCFVISIKQAGTVAVFWPLVSARVASFMLVLIAVLFGNLWSLSGKAAMGDEDNAPTSAGGAIWGTMIAAGILDSLGNMLLLMATRTGRLDVAAVLSSLYPGATVVLALIILKERITGIQGLGIVTALIAVPMIAG